MILAEVATASAQTVIAPAEAATASAETTPTEVANSFYRSSNRSVVALAG